MRQRPCRVLTIRQPGKVMDLKQGSVNTVQKDTYFPASGRAMLSVGIRNDSTYLACVEVLARQISCIKWALYGDDKSEKDMRLYRKLLLVKPNKWQNASEFWRYMEYCRNHYGNAFAYIKPGENGYPEELIPLNPTSMTVMVNTNRSFLNADVLYEYRDQNGRTWTLTDSEVLHLKANCNDGYKGIPTPVILAAQIKDNSLADSYISEVYSNGFGGVMTLQLPADLKPDRQKELLSQVKDVLNSQGKRMLAIPPGIEAKVIGASGIDSSYNALRDKGDRKIAGFMGVPLFMIGLSGDTGSSAMTSAQASAFYNTVVYPIVNQYAVELTYKLLTLRQIQSGVHFENADINGFNMLTAIERVDSYVKLVAGGLITRNEARRELGFARYEDKAKTGDTLFVNGAYTANVTGDNDNGGEKSKSDPAE